MRRLVSLLFFVAVASAGVAADPVAKPPDQLRLFPRDQVRVTVQGEPDMTVDRVVDPTGEINAPLIGAVKVAGLTVGEAQQLIAKRYIDEEIFIHPEVVFTVIGYAPKEVTLLGQVAKQGKVLFPAETTSLSIVEAVAAAGGLNRIAKGDAVRVTRRDAQGGEQNFTVNLDKLVAGKGTAGDVFYLLPGDIVFVPERVF